MLIIAAVNLASASHLVFDFWDAFLRFAVDALRLQCPQVQALVATGCFQSRIDGILPIATQIANQLATAEFSFKYLGFPGSKFALFTDGARGDQKMNVRVPMITVTGAMQCPPHGAPRQTANKIGVPLSRFDLVFQGERIRDRANHLACDHGIFSALRPIHRAPVTEIRAGQPQREHVVGTGRIGSTALYVLEPASGAATAFALTADFASATAPARNGFQAIMWRGWHPASLRKQDAFPRRAKRCCEGPVYGQATPNLALRGPAKRPTLPPSRKHDLCMLPKGRSSPCERGTNAGKKRCPTNSFPQLNHQQKWPENCLNKAKVTSPPRYHQSYVR